MPVAVGLDHRAQEARLGQGGQAPSVVPDGPEVDLGPHGPEGLRRRHGPF